jgi:cupin fold WbuC family metalloprotein
MNLPAIINHNGVFLLDALVIQALKAAAQNSELRRARICLHNSPNSSVQEMIIALCKDSMVSTHRHPIGKPESYHLIEGEMDVNIYNDLGFRSQVINLRQNQARMYRILGGVWHQPIAISNIAIYHEVYTGPFNKGLDVEYLSIQN